MANFTDNLRTAIGYSEVYSILATVTSVDKASNTCDVKPLDSTADFFDVRLQAGKGAGVVLYPAVGSVVVVSLLNKDNAFVSLFSEVELLDIQTQSESLKSVLVDLLAAIKVLTVTTPAGPSGTPVNAVSFTQLENRLNKLFK